MQRANQSPEDGDEVVDASLNVSSSMEGSTSMVLAPGVLTLAAAVVFPQVSWPAWRFASQIVQSTFKKSNHTCDGNRLAMALNIYTLLRVSLVSSLLFRALIWSFLCSVTLSDVLPGSVRCNVNQCSLSTNLVVTLQSTVFNTEPCSHGDKPDTVSEQKQSGECSCC